MKMVEYELPKDIMKYYKDKTILVTGGAGAIGSNLVRELSNLQAKLIIVLDNLSSGYEWNIPSRSNVVFEKGEVTNDIDLEYSFKKKPEIIFHLAALFANRNSIDHPRSDLVINGMGTLKLLEYARNYKVERFIFASSSCVYGNCSGAVAEKNINYRLCTPYAITKLLGEKLTIYFARQYGLNTVILRYFNSFGQGEYPGRYRNVIPNFFAKALRGKPLLITGTGKETRDFNFIKDTVNATIRAGCIPDSVGEIFNVGSGKETKIIDVANFINKITKNKEKIRFCKRRSWDNVLRRKANIQKAKSILGYVPKMEFNEGLVRTFIWVKENWDKIEKETKL